MSTPDTVNTEIVLLLVVTDGPDRAVHANLSYSTHDPYAVQVTFHVGSDDVVEWTFARALLADGVTHPVGHGDVQVWPAEQGDHSGVCLSLSSPSGRALFEAPLPRIVHFLTQTYALVPTGSESDFVDVDRELTALLSDDG
jgi:Streptomyces sporulation and cell division protein, SsgA